MSLDFGCLQDKKFNFFIAKSALIYISLASDIYPNIINEDKNYD